MRQREQEVGSIVGYGLRDQDSVERSGVSATESTSQNITIRLDRRTLRRAKVLAAKRNTSISGLLAQQIESLVGEDARTNRPSVAR